MLAVLGTSGSARAASPSPFFGVAPSDTLTHGDIARMRGVVGSLRIPIYWFQVEARRGEYDFSAVDRVVGMTSDAGIKVLPFVYGSPTWVAAHPARPPLAAASQRRAWARLLRALVRRYGPRGAFWRGRDSRLPIRRWQLWNEPNFQLFWKPRPSARGYARLLKIGARAIRAEDRRTRIVLAGVAPVEAGQLPWVFLQRLYRVRGIKRSFDALAVHPYAGFLGPLALQIAQARAVMGRWGDLSTPLQVTEFGVASGGAFPSPMIRSPAGQALFLRRAYRFLLKNRKRWRLSGAYWFTWRDAPDADPHCSFCQYSGLRTLDGGPKPAWRSFRRLAAN